MLYLLFFFLAHGLRRDPCRDSGLLLLIQPAEALAQPLKGELQVLGLVTRFRSDDRQSRRKVLQANRGFRLIFSLPSGPTGTIGLNGNLVFEGVEIGLESLRSSIHFFLLALY